MSRIVHLGLGNFHRAHQAIYTQDANAAARDDWRITGVSFRNRGLVETLRRQHGRYTVLEVGPGQLLLALQHCQSGVFGDELDKVCELKSQLWQISHAHPNHDRTVAELPP